MATRRPASRSGRVSLAWPGKACVIAGVPVGLPYAHHRAERVGQVLGQLAPATGAGEAGEQCARSVARVEAAALRIAEGVLAEGGRRRAAKKRIGPGQRGVEAEQAGEGVPDFYPLTHERGRFHLRRRGLQLPIEEPALAVCMKIGGVDPVEQLAEEIGVALTHLTHT